MNELVVDTILLHPVANEILHAIKKSHDSEYLTVPSQDGGNAFAINTSGLGASIRI